MSSVEGEKVIERSCPVKWERIKRKAPVREIKKAPFEAFFLKFGYFNLVSGNILNAIAHGFKFITEFV